jgi:hypothetical protein
LTLGYGKSDSPLFGLTEADLEKLGVALGDRKRLLRAIAALPKGRAPADDATRHLTVADAKADPFAFNPRRDGRLTIM